MGGECLLVLLKNYSNTLIFCKNFLNLYKFLRPEHFLLGILIKDSRINFSYQFWFHKNLLCPLSLRYRGYIALLKFEESQTLSGLRSFVLVGQEHQKTRQVLKCFSRLFPLSLVLRWWPSLCHPRNHLETEKENLANCAKFPPKKNPKRKSLIYCYVS